MADYKNMIKGTLNVLGNKAKNYVESGSLKETYDRGTTTAKCYANIAKLNVQINGELEEQKKAFLEIGRLYYDMHRNDPEPRFAGLFEQISEIDTKIETMREELFAAKAAVETAKKSGDISVEIVEEEVTE